MKFEDVVRRGKMWEGKEKVRVERGRREEGGVEKVGRVSGGDKDDRLVRLEGMDVKEDVVESVLRLMVRRGERRGRVGG